MHRRATTPTRAPHLPPGPPTTRTPAPAPKHLAGITRTPAALLINRRPTTPTRAGERHISPTAIPTPVAPPVPPNTAIHLPETRACISAIAVGDSRSQ